MRQIEIFENPELLSIRASELFAEIAEGAIKEAGRFAVALSGGSTPKALYRKLANVSLDWSRVNFYFGDERIVPMNHAESNFRMVSETLFEPLKISDNQIYRWRTELIDPEAIAAEYQQTLTELGQPPRFDLTLLGIGDDCHTASLFPNTDALKEVRGFAVSNWVPKLQTHRLTITFPVINNSSNVLVIVTGRSKAIAVRQAVKGEYDPIRFPIQAVDIKDGREVWILDKDAASLL